MKASGGALLIVVALGILWLVVTGRADGVLNALAGATAATPTSAPSVGGSIGDWLRGIVGAGTGAVTSTPTTSAPVINQLNPLPSYPGYSARTA